MLKTARIIPFALVAALYAMGAATPAHAAKPETYVKNEQAGALGGYDPLSFFSGASPALSPRPTRTGREFCPNRG